MVWRAVHITTEDQATYDALSLQQQRRHMARRMPQEKEYPKQVRYGVTKRIWLSNALPRPSCELKGSRSEVSIFMKKSEARIVETFYDVHGIVQQDLFYRDDQGRDYEMVQGVCVLKGKAEKNEPDANDANMPPLHPMQRFRYFEAERAIYDFATHTLTAYGVHFWTYEGPEHELIYNYNGLWPMATGSATSMTMLHTGTTLKGMQFSAEELAMQTSEDAT